MQEVDSGPIGLVVGLLFVFCIAVCAFNNCGCGYAETDEYETQNEELSTGWWPPCYLVRKCINGCQNGAQDMMDNCPSEVPEYCVNWQQYVFRLYWQCYDGCWPTD